MLGLLIILIALGIGFAAGYGVRATISRRRRRAARGNASKSKPLPNEAPVAGMGRDDVINLEGLLVAANDDLSSRREALNGRPQGDRYRQPEEFDGAVRDLLGELNRRPSGASSHPIQQ